MRILNYLLIVLSFLLLPYGSQAASPTAWCLLTSASGQTTTGQTSACFTNGYNTTTIDITTTGTVTYQVECEVDDGLTSTGTSSGVSTGFKGLSDTNGGSPHVFSASTTATIAMACKYVDVNVLTCNSCNVIAVGRSE